MSASERRQAEAAFAEERDCAIVATSTLELGIDVGDLDRVIQIDSPATVGLFLQRMGRSGRRSGGRRNCLFLATSDSALMNALGICGLWSGGFVEAVVAPAEPWNVVAQQALLMALERGQLPVHELLAGIGTSFPELRADDIGAVVEHLVNRGHLTRHDDGLVQIGPTSEKAYGGRHYRDLMATFSGAALLTARFGSSEVGFLDPAVLTGQGDVVTVLLSGRSWVVREIDWKRRLVWLEPAKEGGKARWMGGGRGMSADLAQSIRTVVRSGGVSHATLSRRAAAALELICDEIPTGAEHVPVQMISPGRYRLWTFAGSTVNRTLMLACRASGAYRSDGLSVDFRMDPRLMGEVLTLPPLSKSEWEPFVEATKFANLLPDKFSMRMAGGRYLADDEDVLRLLNKFVSG